MSLHTVGVLRWWRILLLLESELEVDSSHLGGYDLRGIVSWVFVVGPSVCWFCGLFEVVVFGRATDSGSLSVRAVGSEL